MVKHNCWRLPLTDNFNFFNIDYRNQSRPLALQFSESDLHTCTVANKLLYSWAQLIDTANCLAPYNHQNNRADN